MRRRREPKNITGCTSGIYKTW